MKLAIVDDNKLEQELIFNTLRTYEHERNISLDISSYSDGNSFLNTYVPGDFDLIFMDIYLNELNGDRYCTQDPSDGFQSDDRILNNK